ncbi:MAG: phosphate acyltransferase PlsX [Candidatus Omnitrophica bacterium]|nr:phosphate acyltransferase PlsX [Candidatus Omnitrophota bacterium]MCB9721426.1 phosphate acyltransferase PlsX [Candidatus Omnitrophota bacterium]
MKIVVDAMGGDHAPQAVVAGVIEAIKEIKVHVALVGQEDLIQKELAQYEYPKDHVEVVHAPEVVGMDEPAITPIRRKKNSSITIGINLLKQDGYDAFVSAGNTGAVVAAGTINLGMLEGVDRPAIGTVIPTLKEFSFVIDVGANTEAKPAHLLQSALMAKIYAREVLGVETPTIGLLNIGEEAGKGGGLAKEAYKLMQDHLKNFIGNIEANEVFSGKANCIVCDGFVGNVLLKVSEGLLESVGKLVKREVKKSPVAMIGAGLMKMGLGNLRKLADYSEFGGAPLLGVNGVVMIGHGRSNPKAIKNAIKATVREVEHDILSAMIKELNRPDVVTAARSTNFAGGAS